MEDLLVKFKLMDIKPPHGRLTSLNKREGPGHIVTGIDMFLISRNNLEESISPFPWILPWERLDHHLITLDLSSPIPLGPISFRFNPNWA